MVQPQFAIRYLNSQLEAEKQIIALCDKLFYSCDNQFGGENMTTIHDLIEEVKSNPRIDRAGMIICHNGIVRGFSRDGKEVSKLSVKADRKVLEKIIDETGKKPGIVDVKVHINEGELGVGDDVLLVVVAGDIRDNTFPVLIELVGNIKKSVLEKEDI